MKYKFAEQNFNTLGELHTTLNDPARLSEKAIAREVIRIFETCAVKNDLLDWLDWQDEAAIVAKLEKARSPRMFSTYLLGEDSPRLGPIDGVISSLMEKKRLDTNILKLSLPQTLYRVVDLADGAVSGLGAEPDCGWPEEYKWTKVVLRRIEPGTFMMGSPVSEYGRDNYETQHRVTLTKAYYMGIFEVTQAQWERIMGTNPSHFRGATRPVEQVSWIDCQEFCRKAGHGFRLPTEAEWEYACRAGTTTAYCWGNVLNGDQANCDGKYPYGATTKGPNLNETCAVSSYDPNAWGLYDMSGNVWELCSDWLGVYEKEDATDPKGPSSYFGAWPWRVGRGGAWGSHACDCRSACRDGFEADSRLSYLGIRLCCSAGASE